MSHFEPQELDLRPRNERNCNQDIHSSIRQSWQFTACQPPNCLTPWKTMLLDGEKSLAPTSELDLTSNLVPLWGAEGPGIWRVPFQPTFLYKFTFLSVIYLLFFQGRIAVTASVAAVCMQSHQGCAQCLPSIRKGGTRAALDRGCRLGAKKKGK